MNMTRKIDAILIADDSNESLSASNPLRLQLSGHTATLQVVLNSLKNGGESNASIAGDQGPSWDLSPKLNGIYLQSFLAKAGFETLLINDYHQERDQFLSFVALQPLAVVISTTFIVSRKALVSLVKDIKKNCPSAAIIVGGPFVAFSWRIFQRQREANFALQDLRRDFLFFDGDEDCVDLYIISDVGEKLLEQVLEKLRLGLPFTDLPNTAYPVAGNYRFNERVDDVKDWQEAPIDWAVLPGSVFASGVVPMRASVGCPYQCGFCSFTKNRQMIRLKPLDELVTELKAVQMRGARYVWFADDNFRLGSRDLARVCEHFIAEGLTLKWMTFLRAEVLQDVEPELLRRAGCIEIQMGIESADPGVLAAMNKQSDPDLNEAVITRLLRAGINCSCYFLIGYPGETEVSVAKTIAFLRRLEAVDGPGLLSWSLYPYVLVPGSPISEAEQRVAYALEGYLHTWRHRTMDSQEARRNLVKMFMSLDKSGPIYRGDNLDLLQAMPPGKAKAFIAIRHRLEKLFLGKDVDINIACDMFREVFN